MKKILLLIGLILLAFSGFSQITDKGNYVVYANASYDSLVIQKDGVFIRQYGSVNVLLSVPELANDIILTPSDFGYSNTTDLRTYLEGVFNLLPVEELLDTTNVEAGDLYVYWEQGGYPYFTFDINVSGGCTVTAYCTLDESLAATSETGWADASEELLLAASISDTHAVYVKTKKFIPDRILFKLTFSDATNEAKVLLRKYR